MDDLNMVLVAIGSMLYIIPAISVFSAFGACCFIIYKNNKLEAKYIDKYKLLGTLELQELNYEETEIELTDLQFDDVNLTGNNFEEDFIV